MTINITNPAQVQAAVPQGCGATKTSETLSTNDQGLFAMLIAALVGNTSAVAGNTATVPVADGEQAESMPVAIDAGSGQEIPTLGSVAAGTASQSATSKTGNGTAVTGQTATVCTVCGDATVPVQTEQNGQSVNTLATVIIPDEQSGDTKTNGTAVDTVKPDVMAAVQESVTDSANGQTMIVPVQQQNAVTASEILPAETAPDQSANSTGVSVGTHSVSTTESVANNMPDSGHPHVSTVGLVNTANLDKIPVEPQQTASSGPIPSVDPTGQTGGNEHSPPPPVTQPDMVEVKAGQTGGNEHSPPPSVTQPDMVEVKAAQTANITTVSAQPESVQDVVDSFVPGKDGSTEPSQSNPVPLQVVDTVATLTSVAVSGTSAAQGDNPAGRNSNETADAALKSLGLLVKDGSGPSGIGGPAGTVHLAHKPGHSPAPIIDQVMTAVRTLQTENRSEMRMRLNPPHLGEINLRVVHKDDTLHVELTAQTGLARDLLAARAPELRQALADIRGPVSDLHITVTGGSDASFTSFTAGDGSGSSGGGGGWTGSHDQIGRPYTGPAHDFAQETCWGTPTEGTRNLAWSIQDGHIDIHA